MGHFVSMKKGKPINSLEVIYRHLHDFILFNLVFLSKQAPDGII